MNTHDKAGREYAKFSDNLVRGGKLEADGNFSCLEAGAIREIKWDGEEALKSRDILFGFYIDCDDGAHHLHGQTNDRYTHVVGLYPAKEGA